MKFTQTLLAGLTPLLLAVPQITHAQEEKIERIPVATKGLANPERGFRFEVQIGMDEGEKFYLPNNWPFPYYKDDGIVMTQAYCYLSKYCNSEIPQEKLDALQADFDRARKDGVKFILRFAYQKEMENPSVYPTLECILSHIKRLTPIVRKNIDVIYTLQMGWLGAWGEFHSDPNQISEDSVGISKIAQATLEMLPKNRTSMMRRMLYRNMAEEAAGENKLDVSRIGFYNDGTLADFNDGWTWFRSYPGDPEFDKVTHESPNLPVEGELYWNFQPNPVLANALNALNRFILHHYSTFSVVHSNIELDLVRIPGSIDAWKKTPFTAEMLHALGLPCDDNYFKNNPMPSGYEYIRDHLGYRLQMVHSEGGLKDGTYNGSATIKNVGCARPINPRKVYLVLYNKKGTVYEFPTEMDARSFMPWQEVKVALSGKLPADAPKGKYNAALWLPDEAESIHYRPEYAITFADGTRRVDIGGRLLNVLP